MACCSIIESAMADPSSMDDQTVAVIAHLRTLDMDFLSCIPALYQATRRCPVQGVPENAASRYYKTFWGAPGMTDLLLNDRLMDDLSQFVQSDGSQDMSHYSPTFLIYNILVRTCVSGIPGLTHFNVDPSVTWCGEHDGRGELRDCWYLFPMVPAAASRAMELWYDESTRRRCGMALCPAASLAATLLMQCQMYEEDTLDGEPGEFMHRDHASLEEQYQAFNVQHVRMAAAALDEICRTAKAETELYDPTANTHAAADFAAKILGQVGPSVQPLEVRVRLWSMPNSQLQDTGAVGAAAAMLLRCVRDLDMASDSTRWIPRGGHLRVKPYRSVRGGGVYHAPDETGFLGTDSVSRGSVWEHLTTLCTMGPLRESPARPGAHPLSVWEAAARFDGAGTANAGRFRDPVCAGFFAWLKLRAFGTGLLPLCLADKAGAQVPARWQGQPVAAGARWRLMERRWPVLTDALPEIAVRAIGWFAAEPMPSRGSAALPSVLEMEAECREHIQVQGPMPSRGSPTLPYRLDMEAEWREFSANCSAHEAWRGQCSAQELSHAEEYYRFC